MDCIDCVRILKKFGNSIASNLHPTELDGHPCMCNRANWSMGRIDLHFYDYIREVVGLGVVGRRSYWCMLCANYNLKISLNNSTLANGWLANDVNNSQVIWFHFAVCSKSIVRSTVNLKLKWPIWNEKREWALFTICGLIIISRLSYFRQNSIRWIVSMQNTAFFNHIQRGRCFGKDCITRNCQFQQPRIVHKIMTIQSCMVVTIDSNMNQSIVLDSVHVTRLRTDRHVVSCSPHLVPNVESMKAVKISFCPEYYDSNYEFTVHNRSHLFQQESSVQIHRTHKWNLRQRLIMDSIDSNSCREVRFGWNHPSYTHTPGMERE